MAEGTRVTCTDLATGEEESVVITDNHVVITDGRRYVSNTQVYPGSGTTVITVKTKKD
ncbi:hypothetical protein ACI3EY_07905 [Ornithinimicrobium sp. LYQ92]|uniref:hypothetical protein n=1 Tax=Serinicoccus sp. LYQ92 TaxID=3378798 RepID=UPI003852DA2E